MTNIIKSCVIGYPVKHSLSPKLHGFWLDKYNINGQYIHYEIKPEELAVKIKNLKNEGFVGANVTIPHKEKVIDLMDEVTMTAKKIGAVNTIIVEKDGRLIGDNTDSFGFIENIRQNISDYNFSGKKALVLGSGGAARAVIVGLIEQNVEVINCNRTIDRAIQLKETIANDLVICDWQDKEKYLSEIDLLVNTTSLGMAGQDELIINLDNLSNEAVVIDIVYKPLMTNLLLEAKNRGNKTVDGIGMLLYQAVPGFEYWFGVKPRVCDELKNKILSLC